MPLPAKPDRGDICIYGDSHIGSVKLALDTGLINTGGRQVEFWGANGPAFRGLRWKQGRIVPDDSACEIVAQVNGGRRNSLGPEDFDLFTFYGARLRAQEFFAHMLEHMHTPEGQISSAALQAIATGWTRKTRAWRFARAFAEAGAQVIFVPTPFPSKDVLDPEHERQRLQVKSSKAERTRLWKLLADVAAGQGFTLMPQPDETVTAETMTHAKYAAKEARESQDEVHKNPEFAALLINQALALAGQRWAETAE